MWAPAPRPGPGSVPAMTEPAFRGVAVALITLFDDDLAVDVGATAEHAARLVDAGVSAVLVCGSTGEPEALTAEERTALIRAVRSALPASVPVLAGTGAPTAAQAVVLTRDAVEAGADAVLALSPPFAADPRPYYEALAAPCTDADVPLLAYHFPARSAPGIDVSVLGDLAVDGLKDSSGDADRLLEEVTTWDRPVWPGSSALVSTAAALGCPGVILALANAEPAECVAAFGGGSGDGAAQRRLARAHLAQRGRFPHGIKGLTAARYGTSTRARMG